jgi:hypothetical protein
MAPELLSLAREAAEKSKPDVRAAALLRIARVQTAFDPVQARTTLDRALDETRRLPGRDGEFLMEHARLFAAAVAPDLLPEIPLLRQLHRDYESQALGRIMIEHGHSNAAYEFVMRYDDPASFPFPVASQLIERLDEGLKLTVFRRAVEAWRATHSHHFPWLFQSRWKLMPAEEARDVVREIVRFTLEQPDQPTQATYDPEGTVQITSVREHTLFSVLHILRHLDQPLADSLLADHAQLRAAARRFPYGMESVMQEAEARKKPDGESCGGFMMGGNSRDFPYLTALMQGSRDGDFGPAFEHAMERYLEDIAPENPNQAPLEFWPSTCAFRGILYRAGKRLGSDAAAYLERIPDPDLRLFAQIELAAALAGLPEIQAVQRGYRPGPRRSSRSPIPPRKGL